MRNVRRLFSFISNFMASVFLILCMLLVKFCDVHGISNMKLNALALAHQHISSSTHLRSNRLAYGKIFWIFPKSNCCNRAHFFGYPTHEIQAPRFIRRSYRKRADRRNVTRDSFHASSLFISFCPPPHLHWPWAERPIAVLQRIRCFVFVNQ